MEAALEIYQACNKGLTDGGNSNTEQCEMVLSIIAYGGSAIVRQQDAIRVFPKAAAGAAQSNDLSMGLAISRSIVESYGGRLWATTNDGRGASFHFTLPVGVEKEMSATSI